MALYGALDEMRHSQVQLLLPHALVGDPQFDGPTRRYTQNWDAIALADTTFLANDAVSMAIQLTFTFETGFTNLQFLGMAADAMEVGDIEFADLEHPDGRGPHAQQGADADPPELRQGGARPRRHVLATWHVFAIVTGLSMDYYTPLEHRSMTFKEFMRSGSSSSSWTRSGPGRGTGTLHRRARLVASRPAARRLVLATDGLVEPRRRRLPGRASWLEEKYPLRPVRHLLGHAHRQHP